MEPGWTEILRQLPVVGTFIIFILVWTDRVNKAQSQRDAEMREFWKAQQDRMVEALTSLLSVLETHDRKTDQAIATMKERTRPRRSTGS